MSKTDLELIIKTISKHIKVDEKDINLESKASDFYQWDSLSQVNIILEIEKKMNIEISASKMGELTSVESILNYINS